MESKGERNVISAPEDLVPLNKLKFVIDEMRRRKDEFQWNPDIMEFLDDHHWDHWFRVAIMSEESEKDVAMVLFDMFSDRLKSVHTNGKSYTWFEFDTFHKQRDGETITVSCWQENNSPLCIKDALFRRGALEKEIFQLCRFFELLAKHPCVSVNFLSSINKGLQKVKDACLKIGFTNHIIEASGHLHLSQHFREKLDSNPDIIGFNNGVYDLKRGIFLEPSPIHYVSKTVGYDFKEQKDIPGFDATRKEVLTFFKQLFPDSELRAYVLRSLALTLWGENPEQKFWFYTGEGSNGKSKLLELMREVLGEYAYVFHSTLLTEKKASSNQASEMMAKSKGTRFAYMSEIEKDTRINDATLKELTGGDVIRARHLYKESFEFKPTYKMVMALNDLPNTAVSESVFRRIRVVPFVSLFAENEKFNSEKKKGKRTEGIDLFRLDMALHTKFKKWRMPMMSILIDEFRTYLKEGLKEPAIVKQATTQYKDENNFVEAFVQSCTTTEPLANPGIDKKTKKPIETHTCLSELWTAFNVEFRDEQKNPKSFTAKSEFKNQITNLWGKPETKKYRGKRVVWKGHRLLEDEDEEDFEDDRD